MFVLIRISFAGIIAAPLLYIVIGKLNGRAVWTDNVINLVIRWSIVFAASMFSPLVFRIVTGIIAGWTLFYRTGMFLNSFKSEDGGLRYGDLVPYYFSTLVWIVLFILSFF